MCVICKLCARARSEPAGVGSDFSSLLLSDKSPPFLGLRVLEGWARVEDEALPAASPRNQEKNLPNLGSVLALLDWPQGVLIGTLAVPALGKPQTILSIRDACS